jgi:hypothetical protein
MVALQAPPPAGTLHQVGERIIISITTKLSLALKVCKLFMFPLSLSQEQNSSLGFASSLCVCRTQKTQKQPQQRNEIFTELHNSWRQHKQQEQD